MRFTFFAIACCVLALVQTPPKTYTQNGLSFDYPADWTLQEGANPDAQQLVLGKPNSDAQISVFVHKGRIAPEKMADAKKAFIDPYIAAQVNQFVQMGAKPEQTADSSEIGGVKADGVKVSASFGGETGAAKIYWALVGRRVVILTLFGPDKETQKQAPAWDLVRDSLKVVDPKAAPSPKP
jgi:hypothetical protein